MEASVVSTSQMSTLHHALHRRRRHLGGDVGVVVPQDREEGVAQQRVILLEQERALVSRVQPCRGGNACRSSTAVQVICRHAKVHAWLPTCQTAIVCMRTSGGEQRQRREAGGAIRRAVPSSSPLQAGQQRLHRRVGCHADKRSVSQLLSDRHRCVPAAMLYYTQASRSGRPLNPICEGSEGLDPYTTRGASSVRHSNTAAGFGCPICRPVVAACAPKRPARCS